MQYTSSCMKVGISGNLGLSREYHKKLSGPLFYTWWNCPLTIPMLRLLASEAEGCKDENPVNLVLIHSLDSSH